MLGVVARFPAWHTHPDAWALLGAIELAYLFAVRRGRASPRQIILFSCGVGVLLMSSLTMVLALAAMQRRDQRRMRVWLLTTALLGSVFVGGQAYEFTSFYRAGLSLHQNLFGSSFFVLTGFHGAHVTIGILMLLSLAAISWKGRLADSRVETVELIGLYWHFVDVVWIVIFTVVYLVPGVK